MPFIALGLLGRINQISESFNWLAFVFTVLDICIRQFTQIISLIFYYDLYNSGFLIFFVYFFSCLAF